MSQRQKKVFSLESYLKDGLISKEKYGLLVEHIKKRSNIVIGGETASGKTTLMNAIIDKMVEFTPDDRFYIVEDCPELQCSARNVKFILPTFQKMATKIRMARRWPFRRQKRIIVGEIRYGDVTNELLKAWNFGHTGGITTVHANSALTMISRIRDLLCEVIPPYDDLPDVSQSVQLLVHMIRKRNDKTITINEVIETKLVESTEAKIKVDGKIKETQL